MPSRTNRTEPPARANVAPPGCGRPNAHILGGEKRIRPGEAVALVWGRSAAAKPDRRRAHAGTPELFATQGLNGVILETIVKWTKWHTRREAVERFMLRAVGRRPEHNPQPAPAERPSRRRAAS